jgi:hypothetical protein
LFVAIKLFDLPAKKRYSAGMRTGKKNGKDKTGGSRMARAEAYGIDISALKANLKRTPYERIMRHQIALDTILMLRNAKKV